jgi:hypothetical protein
MDSHGPRTVVLLLEVEECPFRYRDSSLKVTEAMEASG